MQLSSYLKHQAQNQYLEHAHWKRVEHRSSTARPSSWDFQVHKQFVRHQEARAFEAQVVPVRFASPAQFEHSSYYLPRLSTPFRQNGHRSTNQDKDEKAPRDKSERTYRCP